jgi:hypothetical protein
MRMLSRAQQVGLFLVLTALACYVFLTASAP